MSDQRLRDLERRWRETGTAEDEATYLLERLRVGDLSRERLEIAAYCGHEGARRATGGAADAEDGPDDPLEWVSGLDRRWPAAALVFSAGLAVQGLLHWEEQFGHTLDQRRAGLLRKALQMALASLRGISNWPNVRLVIAAEASVTDIGASGHASPSVCGAGFTAARFIAAPREPGLATRTFQTASVGAAGRLSAPFMDQRRALQVGRDAVVQNALTGRTPDLPVRS